MAEAGTSKQARSKQQQFWRLKSRTRLKRLPANMAISIGLFGCLAAVQRSTGAFDAWRGGDYNTQPARDMGDWRPDAFGVSSSSSSSASEQARLLSEASSGTTYTCEPEANSSSVLPAFKELEKDKGSATLFFIVITLFMFLGLAIVCDSFFECSLSAICESLNLKDDVAGATFMAAGGSAPELMTSIIGVFFSRSDVGFGTIVGSAVFNVLFVIAACAFVTAKPLSLTWWPLARDASYYCYSLALIVIFVTDLEIHVWEASFLLLSYIGYIVVMYYNEALEVWVTERIRVNQTVESSLQVMLKKIIDSPVFATILYGAILTNAVMVILEIQEFSERSQELPCICGVYEDAWKLQVKRTTYEWVNLGFNIFFILEMAVKLYAYGFFGYWRVPLNCFDGSLVFLIIIEIILVESANSKAQDLASRQDTSIEDLDHNDQIGVGIARMLRLLKFVKVVRGLRVLRIARLGMSTTTTAAVQPASTEGEVELGGKDAVADEKPAKEVEGGEPAGEEEEDDDDDDGPFDPFEIWGDFSSFGGIFGRCMWFLGLPLSVVFFLTIPDCRRPMFAKYWYITFTNCILWIAGLSTIMVWMVERLGEMYGVPSSIMGIFVLAAGTSIPDCLSSVAVARRGHGDMAVSSSIGSNIFDVLFGLPLPWFMYTAILRPSIGESYGPQWVEVSSEALAVMILLLFVMVALVITSVHLSGWVLSKRLGACMMALYFIFLVVALLLDQGIIFGDCDQ